MFSKLPKHLRHLVAFTVCYVIISALTAYLTSNIEFVFYLLVLLVLAGFTLLIHNRVHFPISLLWCLSLWGLLHMAGGMVPIPESWHTHGPINVLYSFWLIPGFLKYDQLVHAYGFAVATWACWECLRAISLHQGNPVFKNTLGALTLSLFAGLGLGALNETIEFFATLIIPNTNVGDYNNTGWDLVFNLIGGLIAIYIIHKKYRPPS